MVLLGVPQVTVGQSEQMLAERMNRAPPRLRADADAPMRTTW
jgi:hypothetical protein